MRETRALGCAAAAAAPLQINNGSDGLHGSKSESCSFHLPSTFSCIALSAHKHLKPGLVCCVQRVFMTSSTACLFRMTRTKQPSNNPCKLPRRELACVRMPSLMASPAASMSTMTRTKQPHKSLIVDLPPRPTCVQNGLVNTQPSRLHVHNHSHQRHLGAPQRRQQLLQHISTAGTLVQHVQQKARHDRHLDQRLFGGAGSSPDSRPACTLRPTNNTACSPLQGRTSTATSTQSSSTPKRHSHRRAGGRAAGATSCEPAPLPALHPHAAAPPSPHCWPCLGWHRPRPMRRPCTCGCRAEAACQI